MDLLRVLGGINEKAKFENLKEEGRRDLGVPGDGVDLHFKLGIGLVAST